MKKGEEKLDTDLYRYYQTEIPDEVSQPPPAEPTLVNAPVDTFRRWEDVAGNTAARALLKGFVRQPGRPEHVLIYGANRSGKTWMIHLALKAKFCRNRGTDLNPCHACANCQLWDQGGLDRNEYFQPNAEGQAYRYHAVDGTNPWSFDEGLILRYSDRRVPLIVYIDEVAAPEFQPFVPKLWKPMTETNIAVIASGVRLRPRRDKATGLRRPGLSEDFRFRFALVETTTAPCEEDFLCWLGRQCQDRSLDPDDATLRLIVEKAELVPGQALRPLRKAKALGVPLTREFVEQFRWDAL